MAKIFHVVPVDIWNKLKSDKKEYFSPDSLQAEGFIHCCKADQLAGVIDRFFMDHIKLVIIRVTESKLEKEVVYEAPAEAPNSGLLFPHYYGALPVSAVEKEFKISRKSKSEKFLLPNHLLS